GLTRHFQRALKYRDLLEAKLDFAQYVAPDLIDHFTSLIARPRQFMQNSRTFDLFDYRRCLESTPENYRHVTTWMRFTTTLTRYEARACMQYQDFSRDQQVLDIGGNSGEFVLQLCKVYPKLRATVFDLPVVCDVAQQHLAQEPEAARIRLIKGDAVANPLPSGMDLVVFKSFLHDWPEKQVTRFLASSYQSLDSGGTLLIFERGPIPVASGALDWSMIPMLLFFRSFRRPEFYERQMELLGLHNIQVQQIDLDVPFFLITGQKD
ncbi:MAG: methyltransferase domain-containing protein, partial [Pirellulales bacterium]|nr:methyltransferase domain-containing protein [Pirellulales bacterium]